MRSFEMNLPVVRTLRERVSRTRRRGLTLIEAAMVLAILALVVAGIMLFYTSANTSRLTTRTLSDLANIQQTVRSIYGGQSTYTGLNNDVLVNSQALPTGMVAGAAIRHSFNGIVTVAPATVEGIANAGFTIEFNNIPGEACSRMATQDLGRGLRALTIGGTNIVLPANVGAVTNACQTNNNIMRWTFN